MTKPLVTFQTFAYNAEAYIVETIESVLNQSDGNFEYFIRDNGSTDRTGEICRAYAEKDRRIQFLQNKVNWILDNGEFAWIGNMFPPANGEYVSYLDSDDYLDINFVKDMYAVAKQNNADIVICGTSMFHDGLPQNRFCRIPPSLVISSNHNLSNEEFINLYGSLRPIWAKLYRTKFYVENILYACSCPKELKDGTDTYISLSYMQKAQSIVCLDKALHNYRIRESSRYHSAKVDILRIKDGEILFNKALEYLKHINLENDSTISFLVDVYFFHVKDLINLSINSKAMTCAEKIEFIEAVMNDSFFCSYAFSDSTCNYFIEIVGNIFNSSSNKEKIDLLHFYTVRLYKSSTELKCKNNIYFISLYLSALCDKNNKYLWGFNRLNEFLDSYNTQWSLIIRCLDNHHKEILLRNHEQVRKVLNSSIEESKVSEAKLSILDFIEKKEYMNALELVESILTLRPLDREALYFKIYIAYVLGNMQTAYDFSYIAKVFWSDDEDILQIAHDIEESNNQR